MFCAMLYEVYPTPFIPYYFYQWYIDRNYKRSMYWNLQYWEIILNQGIGIFYIEINISRYFLRHVDIYGEIFIKFIFDSALDEGFHWWNQIWANIEVHHLVKFCFHFRTFETVKIITTFEIVKITTLEAVIRHYPSQLLKNSKNSVIWNKFKKPSSQTSDSALSK